MYKIDYHMVLLPLTTTAFSYCLVVTSSCKVQYNNSAIVKKLIVQNPGEDGSITINYLTKLEWKIRHSYVAIMYSYVYQD